MNLFPEDVSDGPYERPKQPMKQAEEMESLARCLLSQAEIIHLRIEAFTELKRLYSDVMHGRYDNTNTRQRLDVVQAMHAACCRELDLGVSCPSKIPSQPSRPINGFGGKHEAPPASIAEKGGVQ